MSYPWNRNDVVLEIRSPRPRWYVATVGGEVWCTSSSLADCAFYAPRAFLACNRWCRLVEVWRVTGKGRAEKARSMGKVTA